MIDDDWPRCKIVTCDNRVDPRRIALGYEGCVEEHGQLRKQYTVIPVPKSNGVVGSAADLIGIAGSHKGSTMSSMVGAEPLAKGERMRVHRTARVFHIPKLDVQEVNLQIKGISLNCARRVYEAEGRAGGYYWPGGDRGLAEGYQLGLLTSKSEPSRLTRFGELVRVMLQQGKMVDIEELRRCQT